MTRLISVFMGLLVGLGTAGADQPNIVWITSEDMDPDVGCYGDSYAHTPNLDALAAKGVRYTRCFATAPACSPARSALITGVWPNSIGTPHLRNRSIQVPPRMPPYPSFLREAGYYCTNNKKKDYNYDWPDDIWNESSGSAHWRNRKEEDQPFFSVFNFVITHQSRIRPGDTPRRHREMLAELSDEERHDPAKAPVPPYYPDTAAVRGDIARHYDTITALDKQVGEILDQLKADGLADDTIVFFYSDHGRGMPRHKRWLHDSGMQVPLIVYFPKHYRHLAPAEPGKRVDRLVSFIDFPPSLLSLVGLPIPDYMQGVPFLGGDAGRRRQYVHGSRDRIDEVLEISRSVRDDRYLYIRNYLPHRPSLQYSHYSERTPTRQELHRMAKAGKLIGPPREFLNPTKPPEELYDTAADPHQVNNLADDPEYQEILRRLRSQYREWSRKIRDVCLLPEPEMLRRARAAEMTIHDWRLKDRRYPYDKVFETAELVGRSPEPDQLTERMRSDSPGVRFWAATACLPLGRRAEPATDLLLKLLDDPSPSVRIAAAEAVANLGHADRGHETLSDLLTHRQYWSRLYAGIALRYMRSAARPALAELRAVAEKEYRWPYLNWLLQDTADWLEEGSPPVHGYSASSR